MSGHSKWAGIKHKKAIVDAKRGKIFTKIIRDIIVATKEGGARVENNSRLKKAVECAKEINMPQNNIKRAIQKSGGNLYESIYSELVYEGYGPGGVALIVNVITNNKNRTASDIRRIFSKYSGSFGETGCVSWMFERKGRITVNKFAVSEEVIIDAILDTPAEDFKNLKNKSFYEIITAPTDLELVISVLECKSIPFISTDIIMIPKIWTTIEGNDAKLMLEFIDKLKNHDDVKNIYTNFNIITNDIKD
ncbi:MAG: YebC/PmpR family DNA-binding transcriptional regulator [Endomicrobium sp.]|jgi:YebC/PmpR family DNA-binding regulatory protein|nr:YebC/PmpR family DNA-binding transcriptional regulator [Endomicrobium sp.]